MKWSRVNVISGVLISYYFLLEAIEKFIALLKNDRIYSIKNCIEYKHSETFELCIVISQCYYDITAQAYSIIGNVEKYIGAALSCGAKFHTFFYQYQPSESFIEDLHQNIIQFY